MLSKKKKNMLLVTVSIAVVVLAVVVISTRKTGTLDTNLKSFAVRDTASITKIFLANSVGDKTLLERTGNAWIVNKKYDAVMNNILDLLHCIQNIEIKGPVSKLAQSNVNKQMAVNSTKVEIYYTDHRIKIGKLKLWEHTKKKTYYIGQPTQDNMGSYAIMEGAKIPYVVYLPGFRGFVTPKYSSIEDDWRCRLIVDLRLAHIEEVLVTDFENADNSLRIVRSGNRNFDIFHYLTNKKLEPYDTLKLLDNLFDYRNLNYEAIVNKLSQAERDSIFDRKFKELTVFDTKGNKTTITMFHLQNEYDTISYEYLNELVDIYNYDRDRFYAIINGNKDEIVLCQYFVFDRMIQPFEYYMVGSTLTATPKNLR